MTDNSECFVLPKITQDVIRYPEWKLKTFLRLQGGGYKSKCIAFSKEYQF
jgi:hypothetical protein